MTATEPQPPVVQFKRHMSTDEWTAVLTTFLQSPGSRQTQQALQVGIMVLLLDIRDRLPPLPDHVGGARP